MKDTDIRSALKYKALKRYLNDANTIIIDELGINNGSSRVDVALVNGIIHGFEIKSDSDSLSRLPAQISSFSSVLDRVTLVVGYKLAGAALKMIPDWWGVKLAELLPNGGVKISEARTPRNNPQPDKHSIVKLLWRDEALELLGEIDSVRGLKSKPRQFIYAKLADVVELDVLRSRVRFQLKNRTEWRVVERQM